MSHEELTVHRYTCDACGEAEDYDDEGIPLDWTTDSGDQHYCGACS